MIRLLIIVTAILLFEYFSHVQDAAPTFQDGINENAIIQLQGHQAIILPENNESFEYNQDLIANNQTKFQYDYGCETWRLSEPPISRFYREGLMLKRNFTITNNLDETIDVSLYGYCGKVFYDVKYPSSNYTLDKKVSVASCWKCRFQSLRLQRYRWYENREHSI